MAVCAVCGDVYYGPYWPAGCPKGHEVSAPRRDGPSDETPPETERDKMKAALVARRRRAGLPIDKM